MAPKIYADFQNLDDLNRLKLNCAGTAEDLRRHGIDLKEGLVLTFYTDDGNEQGDEDELRAEGTVHFNDEEQCWVGAIDWKALWHASDEQTGIGSKPRSARKG